CFFPFTCGLFGALPGGLFGLFLPGFLLDLGFGRLGGLCSLGGFRSLFGLGGFCSLRSLRCIFGSRYLILLCRRGFLVLLLALPLGQIFLIAAPRLIAHILFLCLGIALIDRLAAVGALLVGGLIPGHEGGGGIFLAAVVV